MNIKLHLIQGIYKVNETVQNSGWYTNKKTILGNYIYGAFLTYKNALNYPFYSSWWLASPNIRYDDNTCLCAISGGEEGHMDNDSVNGSAGVRLSLFANVEL